MIDELNKYTDEIAILLSFISGDIDGPELQIALESTTMNALLSHFENPKRPATSNHAMRLEKQDRKSIGGLLNTQGIIEDFLVKAEVEFNASTRYHDAYSLILESLPSYLDPPMEIIMPLIPTDESVDKAQKKKVLRKRLKDAFPYVYSPPKWIQEPDWPISEGGIPLVFLGQIEIDAPEFFHDAGAAYLFFCKESGACETVLQFY